MNVLKTLFLFLLLSTLYLSFYAIDLDMIQTSTIIPEEHQEKWYENKFNEFLIMASLSGVAFAASSFDMFLLCSIKKQIAELTRVSRRSTSTRARSSDKVSEVIEQIERDENRTTKSRIDGDNTGGVGDTEEGDITRNLTKTKSLKQSKDISKSTKGLSKVARKAVSTVLDLANAREESPSPVARFTQTPSAGDSNESVPRGGNIGNNDSDSGTSHSQDSNSDEGTRAADSLIAQIFNAIDDQ
jgi:hypothetical protein